MIAIADSSPLVVLAKLGCFDLLNKLFSHIYISPEVHYEVAAAGAGLPGALEVSEAEWIEVKAVDNPGTLIEAKRRYGLGWGETSTILLSKELGGRPVLVDDYRARRWAKAEGLEILGSVGLLETFYLQGHLADLRLAFRQLLANHVYVDMRLLNLRLRAMGLPELE